MILTHLETFRTAYNRCTFKKKIQTQLEELTMNILNIQKMSKQQMRLQPLTNIKAAGLPNTGLLLKT